MKRKDDRIEGWFVWQVIEQPGKARVECNAMGMSHTVETRDQAVEIAQARANRARDDEQFYVVCKHAYGADWDNMTRVPAVPA